MDIPSIMQIPIIKPVGDTYNLLKEYAIEKNVEKINKLVYELYDISEEEIKEIEGE